MTKKPKAEGDDGSKPGEGETAEGAAKKIGKKLAKTRDDALAGGDAGKANRAQRGVKAARILGGNMREHERR
jgi:hypothetical protein